MESDDIYRLPPKLIVQCKHDRNSGVTMWSRWFDHVGRYLEDEWYGEAMMSIVIPIRAAEARQLAQMFEQIANCLMSNRAHACLGFTTLTDDVCGWF